MATLQERITEVVTAIGREIKNLKGVQTEVETIAGKVELLEQCCEELKNQTPVPEDPNKVKQWTEALNLVREDRPQLTTEEQKAKTRRWVTETYRIEGSKHYLDLYTYIDSVKFTLELDFFADKATITGEEGTVVWISHLGISNKDTEVGRIGPDNKLEIDISNLPYSNLPYSGQSNYYFIYNNPAYGNFDNQVQFNIGTKKNYYNVVTSLEGKAYFVMNTPTGFTLDKFKQNNPNLANLTNTTIGYSGYGVVDFRSPDDYLPFQFNSGAQKYATVNLVPFKFKPNNVLGGYPVPYPDYGTVIYTEEVDPNKQPPFMSETFNIGDAIIYGNDIHVYIKCDTYVNSSGGIEYIFDTYFSSEGWTKYYNSYGYSYDLIGYYGFEMKRPFNKTKFNSMTVGSYDDDMRIKKVSDTEIDLYIHKGISDEEVDFLTVRLNLLDANESQNDNEYLSLNNRNPFYVSTFHNPGSYY